MVAIKFGMLLFWVACIHQVLFGVPESELSVGALYVMVGTALIHIAEYAFFVGFKKIKISSHKTDFPMTLFFGLVHLGPLLRSQK